MKRPSPKEQQLMPEARDLLYRWALAEPQERDGQCSAVVAVLNRLGDELPRERVLPFFIGSAAFAAGVSLAREGKHMEAQGLISDLRYAARLCDSAEAVALLDELRADLARYSGDAPERDEAALMASAFACFNVAGESGK